MNRLVLGVVLTIATLPLAAQRGPGAIARAPGNSGFVRPPFLEPGVIDRQPRPLTAGPIPFPPADREWLRATTPRFVVVSAIGDRHTRTIAQDLEKLTAILTRTSDYFRVATERTEVFLFAEQRNSQPYFDALRGARIDAASGITLRHPKGTVMLIDATARGGAMITARHELVHDLLRRDQQTLPLWIEEGLADYYANGGQPIREHASRLRGRLKMPLAEMFATRAESRRAWTFDFYAQSWAAVATLIRRDPRAFFEFIHDIDGGSDQVAALRTRFRLSPRELETAMRNAGAPAPSLLLGGVTTSIDVAPITRGDLLAGLGDVLARAYGRDIDAERHFRAAMQASPSGTAQVTFAEFLVSRGCTAEARSVAAEALALDSASRGRAEAVIGLSHLIEDDADAAVEHLRRADFTPFLDEMRVMDARRLLLRVDLSRADTLAREGKVAEAARLLRELGAKMPARTRENLDAQAARLEKLVVPR